MKRTELNKLSLKRRRDRANGKKWRGHANVCNETMILNFTNYIMQMAPPQTACDLLGISNSTYRFWKQKGAEYENAMECNEKPNPDHEIFYRFLIEERLAQGKWKMHVINRSLNPDDFRATWIRDMTILERRDRNNWGKHDTLEVQESEYDPDDTFL